MGHRKDQNVRVIENRVDEEIRKAA